MSALSLPTKPRTGTSATGQAPSATGKASSAPGTAAPRAPRAPGRPDLRLVHSSRRSSLAPTGPLQAWRRRIGVLVVLVALVVLAVQAMADGPAAAPAVVPVSTATVVVQPGETLWDIAAEHGPDGTQPAAYVHELAELNGITNGAVEAWQVLRLPDA